MGLFKRKRKPDEETENLKAFLDMIAPSIVKFETGYYICGNTFRCIWALREYPTSTDDLAILRHLGEKHGVTLHIYTRMVSPLEERKIVHNAEIRNRMNRGSAQDMQRAVEAESNLQDVVNLIGSLHRNKEPLLHCAVYIEMIAGDMQELQILQTNVEVELMRSKLNVDRLKLRQQAGFCAVSPVGFNVLGTEYERVLPASSVANLFPFNYSGKTDRKGFYIGKDKYGSNIVVDFDQRDEDKTSANVLILGNSGQGKSYLMKLLLLNFLEAGKSVITLDVEHEQWELCQALGGCFADIIEGTYKINLLEPRCWDTDADPYDVDAPKAFRQSTRLAQHTSFLKDVFRTYRRSKTCSGCGASTYDYADHSYSYGSWVSDSETQHKRTKTCSACGDSGYEYADHVDTDGDGKCDTCGATVSLTVTWDAGSNGGTIDGKATYSETVQPNSKPTIPASLPIKKGHSFKGWYTAKTGGKLYNTVTSITASTTFYAQFEANKYVVIWDLGTGQSETTEQTYGEKLLLPKDPERKNAEFLGWFTEATGGTQVTANDTFTETADKTYYAHWEITEVFSVTVPVTLPLVVDESGEVHTGSAEIINASTGTVVVSSVSISTKNGWQLVPYTTDMAHEKVDAKLLGFKINDAQTNKTGDTEIFSLTSPWEIAENSRLPLSYDAVVSAVSKAVTEQEVLSIVFVLEWGGE